MMRVVNKEGFSGTQQSIFGFTEGKFNVETVFLGNFTSLNKYILQQYTEEIKFTQGKGWLGFDIYFYQIFTKDHATAKNKTFPDISIFYFGSSKD